MPTETRTQRRELSLFRRTSIVVVVVLAVTSGILGAANTLQGPRLSSAEINGQGAISRTGQRLILHTNQPVAHVAEDQISITPSVPFTTTTSGNDVIITLDDMLRYNADYTVSASMKSLYSGAPATLEYSFTTPDIDVYTLTRDPGGVAGDEPDRVVRSSLSGATPSEDVFTAGRIQEYAVSGSTLAMIVLDEQDRTSLVVRDLSTGIDTDVHVPRAGALRYLKSSGPSGLFGFTVAGMAQPDGSTSPTTLFVYDLATPNGVARQVTGAGGSQLSTVAWAFAPGTTSAVVQDYDQQLYLVDTITESVPSPLGDHAEVHGFIPGTVELVVSDLDQSTVIDLQAAKSRTFIPRTAEVDRHYYPGKRLMIDHENSYIQEFDIPDENRQYSTSALYLIDSSGTREIYRPAPTTRIRNVCLSPNGKVAAVETMPESRQDDDYPNIPSYLPMTTYFVDVATNQILLARGGWMPDWCQ
ncbi:Ig-like domain-containing protein [Agreia sp. COWG]|uniref:Ig-like domain-containing protein n=1 Tax=Agreia sp. COWG TaxID=2773266 RepID=UPI00192945D5|nr:Ig-like domain-containing protein [Agreia sp. COWG]CAD6011204.1 conserved protein of unknown function [Agreia sp. COWG]